MHTIHVELIKTTRCGLEVYLVKVDGTIQTCAMSVAQARTSMMRILAALEAAEAAKTTQQWEDAV